MSNVFSPSVPAPAADCERKLTRKDFQSAQEVRWCPGCGDFSVLLQVQKLLPELGVAKENVCFVSGIGCSSRFPYYMSTYGFHTIHGRAPAVAMGVKAANPDLSVWVITGDGDALSIGTNHLIHCLRRNIDFTVLLFNNRIYGLTKGQYSPTSEFGKVTKSSPLGTIEQPIRPVQTALAAEATFVARTIYADQNHLAKTLEAAARHKGAAFVEVLQNSRVFNDDGVGPVADRTDEDARIILEDGKPIRFGHEGRKGLVVENMQPRVVDLVEHPAAEKDLLIHNTRADSPALAALLASLEPPEFPMPLGVFRALNRPTYEDQLFKQINDYIGKRGRGDIGRLLNSGTTWVVDE